MKIVNQTNYNSQDLRAIIQRCAEMTLETEKRKRVVVTVVYARQQRGASGCATIGGRFATVRVTRDHPRPDSLACVTVHEFRHLNGWSHAEMKARYSDDDLARYSWANEMGIGAKQQKPKPTASDKSSAALAHAQRMFVRSQTRLKRAQTISKKWHAKVRYYERKMAACAAWSI